MTVATLPTVAERVADGATWLDEQEPGWVHRIDRERLDLSSCSHCIGGQLSGGEIALVNPYMRWRTVHNLSHDDSVRLGFNRPLYSGEEYDPLTEAWRDEIAARLDREVASDAR